MAMKKYNVIGLMSGTSLDGIDVCNVEFSYDKQWSYSIKKAHTYSYCLDWKAKLGHAVFASKDELVKLDCEYTLFLNKITHQFINNYNIKNLDAICSHGHTVLHEPDNGVTYQIGNLQSLANGFKCPVVCDFRVADVALGGQGAPLVPVGDKLLFHQYDICLNLGGFANLSYQVNDNMIAYDICPVNIVLNSYVRQLGLDYDDEGKIAETGHIDAVLLNQLNNLEFYKKSKPKSLGVEWVNAFVFKIIDSYKLPISTILKTFIEHAAIQIATVINATQFNTVLITGGGVFNLYLMSRIKHYVDIEVVVPKKIVIEFKEAMIFGFLGILKLRNEDNCLSSVTGALNNHSSGKIYK